MCIICLEYQKGLLTKEEAIRNLGEMIDANLEKMVARSEDQLDKNDFYHLLDVSDELKGKDKNPDVD